MKILVLSFLFLLYGTQVLSQQIDTIIVPKDSQNLPYLIVDIQPIFPGGEDGMKSFFREHSRYALSNKETGKTVYFQIVIDEQGEVSSFKILKGRTRELNEETERLIGLMPIWKPGIKNGSPVKVVKNLSMNFE